MHSAVSDILDAWKQLFDYWSTCNSSKTVDWIMSIDRQAYTLVKSNNIPAFVQLFADPVLQKKARRAVRKPTHTEPHVDIHVPDRVVDKIQQSLAVLQQALTSMNPNDA